METTSKHEELPFISTVPCPSLTVHARTDPRLEYLGIRSYVLTRLALQWRIQVFLRREATTTQGCANLFITARNEVGARLCFYVCVCDSVHRGRFASVHAGMPPPPSKETLSWQGRSPWQGDPLCAIHAGRYGQQAGGMHPTGMQFLFGNIFTKKTAWK